LQLTQLDAHTTAALRQWLADDNLRESARLSAGYQGSTYLYEPLQGEHPPLVIKRAARGFLTGWFHSLMLRREARVYARMAAVDGVPHSPGFLDDEWLVLEYIDGEALTAKRFELTDADRFYGRLLKVLNDFHAAGIAHGDLKRKDNVLVTSDEQPFVIDFGTAVMREGGLWDRLMFRLVRRFDYNAWIKVKYRNDYSAISSVDRQWYRPTIVEAVFRTLRRFWRVVSGRKYRKRWRQARLDKDNN